MATLDPMQQLLSDLEAEQNYLDQALSMVPVEVWDHPSPADGWLLRDCIAHLADVDENAAYVATHKEYPKKSATTEPSEPPADMLQSQRQREARNLSIDELVAWWRDARTRQNTALKALDAKDRLPWAGPPMSVRSFATARLMECWSHGLDALDAAEIAPVDSDRLFHVAHLGVITRNFAYQNRDLNVPDTPIYVELIAPSGESWKWGPEDAPDNIKGTAGDFCRVVTHRIHYTDTNLDTTGELASEFLSIAQAFAGPPGPGREPST